MNAGLFTRRLLSHKPTVRNVAVRNASNIKQCRSSKNYNDNNNRRFAHAPHRGRVSVVLAEGSVSIFCGCTTKLNELYEMLVLKTENENMKTAYRLRIHERRLFQKGCISPTVRRKEQQLQYKFTSNHPESSLLFSAHCGKNLAISK